MKWSIIKFELRRCLDISIPSPLLVLLPYLVYTIPKIYHSIFFSFPTLVLYMFFVVVTDLLFRQLFIRSKKWWEYLLFSSFTVLLALFTYSAFFILELQELIENVAGWYIRARLLLFTLFLLLTAFILFLLRKKGAYRFVNLQLLIFSLLILITPFVFPQKKYSEEKLQPLLYSSPAFHSTPPVLLIVLDEYQSPDDLYQLYQDTGIYRFNKYLHQNGWLTHTSSFSYETSTINSISSTFNFNLSRDSQYKYADIFQTSEHLFFSSLARNLKSNKVPVENYSFLDFGALKPFSRLYYYPSSFPELVLLYTSYSLIKTGPETGNLGLSNTPNRTRQYNEQIFKAIKESAKDTSRRFIYAHLLLPHAPIMYDDNADNVINHEYSLPHYYRYWLFTNEKIKRLLDTLNYNGRFRIILTGDHGYRKKEGLNSNNTYSAFYGFDSTDVRKVESVQDIGTLINKAFTE